MKLKTLLLVFSFSLLIECFANAFNILPLQFFSKPSLMLILIYYFYNQSKNLSSLKNLIIAALIFSWLGDIILLFEKILPFLFIFGLISFLIAHIFYVIYFLKIRKQNMPSKLFKPLILVCLLVYSVAFYYLLFPFLIDIKIPVLVYCIVISLMLVTSFHAFDITKSVYAKICIVGTILFVLSDSILAINRFVLPIPLGGMFVILLYSIGQLLIMEGALRNLKDIDLK